MDKTIIINADDFGLCEGVNRGILHAHLNGVLTSTTLMANMPCAENAVEIAKNNPTLGVGVHLNLTEGVPLKKADTQYLTNHEGAFYFSTSKISYLAILKNKIRKAIEAEFSEQIQWVIDNGIKPTHLDSHKHIHSFPVIFSIVCKLAKKFGINTIRYTFEPKKISKAPWPLSTKNGRRNAEIIRIMAKINRLQNRSFLKTDCLLGIAHTGKIDFSFLKSAVLYNPCNITEIMTHPGFIDGLDKNKTRLVQERKNELDALCDQRTKQCFKDAKIKLVHYGQL